MFSERTDKSKCLTVLVARSPDKNGERMDVYCRLC